MQYTLTAEWGKAGAWSDDEWLEIAGLEATIQDKGDVVEWRLVDMATGREIGGDWLDTVKDCREAAEAAITRVLDERAGV